MKKPRTTTSRVSAYGLIGPPDRLLLCRLSIPGPFRGFWTLPGGGMQPGESGPQTVVREVKEETGLDVEVGDIITAHALWLPGERSDRLALRLIYATKVVGGKLRPERHGSTDACRFFTIDRIPTLPYVDLVNVALGLVAPDQKRPDVPDVARGYFDVEGRLTQWPAQKHRAAREAALAWLAERVPAQKDHTEPEINAILNAAHTFGDPAHLRRMLVDHGLLRRDDYGKRYRRA